MTILSLSSLLIALFVGAAPVHTDDDDDHDKISITVIAIMASKTSDDIEPKLKHFAAEARKYDEKLTGFRIERTTHKKLRLGETEKITLVGDHVVEVTVNKERNAAGRITLTITPPKLTAITYECACGRYFALATQIHTGRGKDREQLFIALNASPCMKKP